MTENQPPNRRVDREAEKLRLMLELFCHDQHGTANGLCDTCRALWDYAQGRLAKCPLRDDKPTCANCTVHCYKPSMRAQVREVMRYAGPRMLYRHPVLAVRHLIDGRRGAPTSRR